MKRVLFIILFLMVSTCAFAETVTIELDEDQYSILVSYAQANNVSVEDYVHDIVSSWADSHIRGFYIEAVKKASKEELKQFFGNVKIKEK